MDDILLKHQRIVLAHYNYLSADPNHYYYYNTCDEHVNDSHIPKSNRNFDDWDMIKFVDLKLNDNLKKDIYLRPLTKDLKKFLENDQVVKCLHVAIEHAEDLRYIANFKFKHMLMLEIYTKDSMLDYELTVQAINALLSPLRDRIIMVNLLTETKIYPLKVLTSNHMFCTIHELNNIHEQ